MIQPSLPMRVTARCWTVPRLIVTNSRIVLPSPISSLVASPPYFLSCGSAPIDANWKIRLPRPIVVPPSITTCGPTRVSAPIRTPAPMTAYAPTSTLPSSSARGSTIALGWMRDMPGVRSTRGRRRRSAAPRLDLAQRAHQLGLGGDLAIDRGLARVLPDRPRNAHDLDLEPELVAGHDGPLEAGAVDAHEVVDGARVGHAAHGLERQDPRSLRQRFDLQHARHHRQVGKVAGEERFVDRHVLDRDDALALLELDHPVDEQHRVAVRQVFEDRADVEGGHSSFLSVRSSRRRRNRHCGNCLSSAADRSHPALSISGNTPE